MQAQAAVTTCPQSSQDGHITSQRGFAQETQPVCGAGAGATLDTQQGLIEIVHADCGLTDACPKDAPMVGADMHGATDKMDLPVGLVDHRPLWIVIEGDIAHLEQCLEMPLAVFEGEVAHATMQYDAALVDDAGGEGLGKPAIAGGRHGGGEKITYRRGGPLLQFTL